MSRPRIYTPEEIRERKRLRGIEYRKRNREKIRAYKKRPEVRKRHNAENHRWREKNAEYHMAYYAAHREQFLEYNRKWRKRNAEKIRAYKQRPDVREKHNAYTKAWQDRNRERVRETNRAWKAQNPDRVKAVLLAYQKAHPEYKRMYRMRCMVREMTDCEYYAERRRKERERANRRRLRMGLTAVGKPARRIPDWCVRGGVLDASSPWLWENVTDEQKAYARELMIERKEWRIKNEWRMAR